MSHKAVTNSLSITEIKMLTWVTVPVGLHSQRPCMSASPHRNHVPTRHRQRCKPAKFREGSPSPLHEGTQQVPPIRDPGVPPDPISSPSPFIAQSGFPKASPYPPIPGAESGLNYPAVLPAHVGNGAPVMFQGLAWAGMGLLAVTQLLPGVAVQTIFCVHASPITKAMVGLAGTTLLPTLLSKHYLKEACATGMMATRLPYQLTLASLVHSTLSLMVLAQAASLRNPMLTVLGGSFMASALLVSAYVAGRVHPWRQVLTNTKGLALSALSLITPHNWRSAAYSLAAVVLAMGGVALLGASPDAPNPLMGSFPPAARSAAARSAAHITNALSVYCCRSAGAGLLASAIIALGLKEVADQKLLDARLPRVLNGGLAVMGGVAALRLGTALATGVATHAHTNSLFFLGSLALAALCGKMAYKPPPNAITLPPPIPADSPLVGSAAANGVPQSLVDTQAAVFLRQLAASQQANTSTKFEFP